MSRRFVTQTEQIPDSEGDELRNGALWVCMIFAMATCPCVAQGSQQMDKYLTAVKTFADNVLAHGRDKYGPKMTPLFVDGINVDTLEPPVWKKNGETWILSNLATQQNLFRTFDGLTLATGDRKYHNAAVSATRYAFRNLRDSNGLLFWGGHCCYDALGDRIVGESRNQEFKHHYPYYDLLWQVDPAATRRLIESSWSAHVIDWSTLDFNRHGPYDKPIEKAWEQEYKGGRVPFAGKGLTFMMSGIDLVHAAAQLSRLSGDKLPLVWAKRLAKRYVDVRHPVTGLGASNFSIIEPDRMNLQFPQFGGRFTEATVADIYGDRNTYAAVGQLRLSEILGADGKDFLLWALGDLTARAKNGYHEDGNYFDAMLIDGTKLSPADRLQNGYVTVKWLDRRPADSRNLMAYALAYKLSKQPLMWKMTRSIASALGIGDIGEFPGKGTKLDQTTCNDPIAIFALLELWEGTREKVYLDAAQRIADNALETRFHNGFFVESKDHVNAKFDDPTPLALLHLRAALGLQPKPPTYWMGKGFFHCPYDGAGRTRDNDIIYSRLRGEPAP